MNTYRKLLTEAIINKLDIAQNIQLLEKVIKHHPVNSTGYTKGADAEYDDNEKLKKENFEMNSMRRRLEGINDPEELKHVFEHIYNRGYPAHVKALEEYISNNKNMLKHK